MGCLFSKKELLTTDPVINENNNVFEPFNSDFEYINPIRNNIYSQDDTDRLVYI